MKTKGNYKDGRTKKHYYCLDCNKEISYMTGFYGKGRCRECYKKYIQIPENNNNFGKRYAKKYYCIDCGKEIDNRSSRCLSCANKFYLHNYKDGRSTLQLLIRALEEYKIWRNKVFKRDNYTCQDCGQIRGDIESHHDKVKFSDLLNYFLQEYNQFSPIEDKETLIRLAINWKPFWDIYNGKTLCKKCHKQSTINKEMKP